MDSTEINEKNNFDTWEIEKVNELHAGCFNDSIGNFLFENDTIKLWDLTLCPNERIPFGRRKSNFSLTCITDGLAISRNATGQINLMRFKKGETPIWQHKGNEIINDFENIGDDVLKFIVIEHKPLEALLSTDLKSFL